MWSPNPAKSTMPEFSIVNSHLSLNGKVVAIIGASGFIGSHLVDLFLREGCEVRAISRHLPGLIGFEAQQNNRYFPIHSDMNNKELISHSLMGVDVVVHLASGCIPQHSNKDPSHDVSSNLLGALNIIECSIKNNVGKFVLSPLAVLSMGIPNKYLSRSLIRLIHYVLMVLRNLPLKSI